MEAYVLALTHELKSPLAAIRGAGELLQDDLQEPDRREFAGLVLAQTGRLQAMVDNMLALSRLEQRHGGLQLENLLWRDVLKPFMPPAHVKPAQHAIEIIVNPALANLLENARSFAPPGTPIVVEATASAVSVRDFGPGVADYALPRLGERFFSTARPDYPGMPTTKGSGLGLAIVKQIMVLHGGSMEVANAGPGLRVTLRF